MTTRVRLVKHRNITYTQPEGGPLKLDVLRPATPGPLPALITVHGGGWCLGDRIGEEALASLLARAGFVVANIDYRLAPCYPYPAARDDVRAAAAWVKAHIAEYDGDARRLGAFGTSAGGHLVALLATLPDTPLACAVSWSGPMDLRIGGGVERAIIRYPLAFLGTCIHADPAIYADASPVHHLTAQSAPLLLMHGSVDDVVPMLQPQLMLQAAATCGAAVEACFLDGGSHGPGDPREPLMIKAWQRVTDFFAQHLQ